jgi:hypothetical protein
MLSSREAITANNYFTLEIRRGNVETSWIMGGLITKEFVITSPKTRCLEAYQAPAY